MRKLREESAKVNRRPAISGNPKRIRSPSRKELSRDGGQNRRSCEPESSRLRMVHGFRSFRQDVRFHKRPARYSRGPRHFTPQLRAELRHEWPSSLPHTEFLDEGNDEDGIFEGHYLDWPDTTAKDFEHFVNSEKQAIREEQIAVSGADEQMTALLIRSTLEVNGAIRDAVSTFRDTRRRLLATPHSWMNDTLRDILGGNSSLWHELLRVTRDVIAPIEELVVVADETRIEFPDTTDIRSLY